MIDIYKNIEYYKPNKICKKLIVFNDMIADMLSNKELNPTATELFIRNQTFLLFSLHNILLLC